MKWPIGGLSSLPGKGRAPDSQDRPAIQTELLYSKMVNRFLSPSTALLPGFHARRPAHLAAHLFVLKQGQPMQTNVS